MRVIVFGAGAVGSVIGGRLRQGGMDVALVARQAHVDAIRASGLRLQTADTDERIEIQAHTSLHELPPGPDDVILITAKTQDVGAIHTEIARWNPHAAIVCGTNGVEHERMALRRFDRVYGMVIQLPASFEHPGEVTAFCLPTNAIIDLGRYPHGVDDTARAFAAAANSAPHVLCEPDAEVMVKKYDKILVNLGNAAEAAIGIQGRFVEAVKAAQAEARDVYRLVGIPTLEQTMSSEERAQYRDRRETMQFKIPPEHPFLGGSTWQSLAKGATGVETDYFNGEIVLLGRMHDVATPHNLFLQQLTTRLVNERRPPASMNETELDRDWKAFVDRYGSPIPER